MPEPTVATIHVAKATRLPMRREDDGVLLEVVRVAAPCKLLDDTIGRGAQEALRRRGGSVFRELEGGTITVGDVVRLLPGADGAWVLLAP